MIGGLSATSPSVRRLASLAQPLPVLLGLGGALHRYDTAPEPARREADPARSIAIALGARGFALTPGSVHVLPGREAHGPLPRRERAVVAARKDGALADVYLVHTRRAPDGTLLEISAVDNLSETSAADERGLVASGERAAWLVAQDDVLGAVQLADFAGEPTPAGREWTLPKRVQNALTNLQETGQLEGVGRRFFKLSPPGARVVLGLTDRALVIDRDAHKVEIPLTGGPAPSETQRFAIERTPRKAQPGDLVTWAVDRVRYMPWFGDKNVQLIKAVAFEAGDQLDQIVSSVAGDDGSTAVAEELGELTAAPTAEGTDPESGWPPAPIPPIISPALKGEGKWVRLDGDPFVGKNPGTPSPFVFSFIRSDRKRIYSQIFVTLWDPRQVELHPVSGTVEPKSATGETGRGEIPRRPEVMKRVVGAFNGGFQAVHGAFGMMAERVVYLPPRPYAATVALMEGGSTGFGTWPESSPVPREMLSFRQNMTPLVVDEVPNPYKRHWWGGVPPGWTQEARTVRSAVCMTREGFVAYFYGAAVDPDVLAAAMVRTRCSYGIHLDMNAGHTGLEFYRAARAGELPDLGRRLDDLWEARGSISGMPGWEFMGRRMIRLMALMNFPRYIGTEQRDFFYLTLRPVLPGKPVPAALSPAQPGEGVWRTRSLQQYGFPPAIATTQVRPDAARPGTTVSLLKLDPRLVRAPRAGESGQKRVVELRTPADEKDMTTSLWHSERTGFAVGRVAPDTEATRLSLGYLASERASIAATAASGIDEDGMLVYARVTEGSRPESDGALLRSLLESLGCRDLLFFPKPLGTELAPPGAEAPVRAPGSGVVLVRAEGPGAKRIFSDTPIVGPKRWAPLQTRNQR